MSGGRSPLGKRRGLLRIEPANENDGMTRRLFFFFFFFLPSLLVFMLTWSVYLFVGFGLFVRRAPCFAHALSVSSSLRACFARWGGSGVLISGLGCFWSGLVWSGSLRFA